MVRKKFERPAPEINIVKQDVLKLRANLARGEPLANLVIADPPYNLGMDYDAHDDNKPQDEYLAWTRKWLEVVHALSTSDASFWLFMSRQLVSEVDLLAKDVGWRQRGHVIWYYTFGVNSPKNFTPSHTHLLYYTKQKTNFTFNADCLKVPSARQIKYNDKRAKAGGRLPDDTWILFPEQLSNGFNPAGDVWLQSRVCGTFKARQKVSPNQIPLPIMDRIVQACSNEGDLVLDPFCGTGTTALACLRWRRNCFTCDISKACVDAAKKRLEEREDLRRRQPGVTG